MEHQESTKSKSGPLARISAVLLWGLVLLGGMTGIGVHASEITGVRVSQHPEKTRVVFDLSKPVQYKVFTLAAPDRIVIDFADVDNARPIRKPALSVGPVAGMRSSITQKNMRVVLDVNGPMKPTSKLLKPNGNLGHRLFVDLPHKAKTRTQNTVKTIRRAEDTVKTRAEDVVVAIDAGHGGRDPGAVGFKGTREKDVVLQIAKRLYKVLRNAKGIKPVLIRNGDFFLQLQARRKKAQETFKADLFVSIHADAFDKSSVSGASVYTLSTKGASSTVAKALARNANQNMLREVLSDLAMDGSMEHSHKVGSMVLEEMSQVATLHKKRVGQANFAVLRTLNMPSILIETGFISNRGEEKKLKLASYQQNLAEAIGRGIVKYFERVPPPETYFESLGQEKLVYLQHKVKRGETLSGIAQFYKVNTRKLLKINSIKNDNLVKEGQEIQIPPTSLLKQE